MRRISIPLLTAMLPFAMRSEYLKDNWFGA